MIKSVQVQSSCKPLELLDSILSSESSALFLAEGAMELNVPIGLPFPLWIMTWNNKSEDQFLARHVHGVIYQAPLLEHFPG
jgi:hypothetical protein